MIFFLGPQTSALENIARSDNNLSIIGRYAI